MIIFWKRNRLGTLRGPQCHISTEEPSYFQPQK